MLQTLQTFKSHLSILKQGYEKYSWVFNLLGLSALIGKLFGLAGTGAVILSVLIFYGVGHASNHLEKKEKKEA